MGRGAAILILGILALAPPALAADEPASAPADQKVLDGGGPPIEIRRTAGEIILDGDLSDPGWGSATAIETWWETNIAESGPPPVRNVGYLAYDDRFLYAAFRFYDPEPDRIRAPIGDHDNISDATDYGGLIIDADNDGRTGALFLANARGLQYDALNDDTTGNEDSSPDFFWDSKGAITSDGWTLEIRIPFSSLRYLPGDVQTWRIMLYRNWPHGRHFQMFTTKLPRGGNCFVCWSNTLTGLSGLPQGGHLIVAPYVTAQRIDSPGPNTGDPVEDGPLTGDGGLDAKWTPNANTVLDLALNPDFSQVESDVAQIEANQRFALFYPEKRPFFLESVELFSTPIQAAYTRSIGSPRWGGRGTGRIGQTAWTVLASEDRGGSLVIVPGADGSSFVQYDVSSIDLIGRMRHDMGSSFVSGLFTVKENDDGSFNRVLGPDFQWRPNDVDSVTGQLLYSSTRDPDNPNLFSQWNRNERIAHSGHLTWSHSTSTWDWLAQYQDTADGFRADLGFVPQVGFREAFGDGGHTWRPQRGFLSRIRLWGQVNRVEDRDGNLINTFYSPGVGMDGKWNSFLRLWVQIGHVRAGSGPESGTLPRERFQWIARISPSRVFSNIEVSGVYGKDVDFDGARPGWGGTVNFFTKIRPGDRLELQLIGARSWLDVYADGTADGDRDRLFTSIIERLRAQYQFTSRMYLRLIGQYLKTTSDPGLYSFTVPSTDSDFKGSFLFSYKLNWQSVLFVGYGEDQTYDAPTDGLMETRRSFFIKVSYAFQR